MGLKAPLVSEEQMELVTSILGNRLLIQGMTSEEADYVIFNKDKVERLLQNSATEFLNALRGQMQLCAKHGQHDIVHNVVNIDRRRTYRDAFFSLRSKFGASFNVTLNLLDEISRGGSEEVKLVYRPIPQEMGAEGLKKLAEGLRPDILAQITNFEQNSQHYEVKNSLCVWGFENKTFSFLTLRPFENRLSVLCRRQATTFDGRFWLCGVPMQ